MSDNQDLSTAIDYLKGRDVTEKLKKITQSSDFLTLAKVLGVPKSTISTWHQRKMTPFEVIIRTHLRTGASVRYMVLGEGEAFPGKEGHLAETAGEYQVSHVIEYFDLTNGELNPRPALTFDQNYLKQLGVAQALLLEYEGHTYLIDKEVNRAVHGTYLIDIDGLISVNDIQRLPGQSLAIRFGDAVLTVNEEEIKVTGKVVQTWNRE